MAIYKKKQGKGEHSFQSPYKRRLVQIAKLANYEPKASILSPNNDFNYTYAKDGHLKRKIKMNELDLPVICHQKSEERVSSGHVKLPKIESKSNRLQNNPTLASEPKQHLLTLDTRIDTEQIGINSCVKQNSGVRSPQSPKSPQNMGRRQKVKKIRQRYQLNQISSDQSQQSDCQFSTNATPGPGYYSVNDTSFYRNSRKLTDFSFGSKASRFIQKKPEPEPRRILRNPQQQQKQQITRQIVHRKKLVPFLSCSLKHSNFTVKQQLPGPQDYRPRNGIQQQLIKKIQRNFKGNFGVYEERFKSIDQYPNLGPGVYKIQKPQQEEVVGSYYFLSQKKRFQ